MFTSATKYAIQEKYNEIVPILKQNKEGVLPCIDKCSEEEQIMMKFLYASMPISDIADYDFETFQRFAGHALFLKMSIPWCTSMPDDIFLNYVLFYRVNNENIEDCRKLFYDCIHERIADKTMYDAVLEVNYWCLENVVYRSTDARTASPLTVWRTASGRCGEESIFTVTALRSMGIPARQIYTPRWSHCDDNHAWVEVWCDGTWHYIGACEPEQVLNSGWFTKSASRAMLIHCKVFSPIILNDEIIGNQGKAIVLNRLKNYADCREFSVKVIDESYKPVVGAIVQFEVLNESAFYLVASMVTNEHGEVEITIGLADIHIHVRKGKRFTTTLADTSQRNAIVIQLKDTVMCEIEARDFKINVPEGDINRSVQLTEVQKTQQKLKMAHADRIREEKTAAFYSEKEADEAIAKYSCKEELKSILYKAKGNFKEISKYLCTDFENDNRDLRVQLLKSLSDKDFCEIKSEILLDHFQRSLPFCDKFEEDIFVKYVMCPRIYFEKMISFREFIFDYFDDNIKTSFKNDPRRVWDYVLDKTCVFEEREYEELFTSPQGLLQMKQGSILSRRILFTAICRTLGIPARINLMTLFAEYYQSGFFIPVEKDAKDVAKLVIQSLDDTQWGYMKNWSLGLLEDGAYRTFDLCEVVWQNGLLTVELPVGFYRLLVSNRMPNGSLLAREYCYKMEEAQTTRLSISLPDVQISDLLENKLFSDFKLTDEQGNGYKVKEVVNGKPTVIIWLEEGKEPTEHILNELMEYQTELESAGHIIFVLRNKEALTNATLQKTLQTNLNIALYYGDFIEDAPAVAKSLYIDHEKFPFVIVTCDGENAAYAFGGYIVGMADLLLKIIHALNSGAC